MRVSEITPHAAHKMKDGDRYLLLLAHGMLYDQIVKHMMQTPYTFKEKRKAIQNV